MRTTSTFSQPKKFKKKTVKEASCDHDFSASVGVNLKVIARISNVQIVFHIGEHPIAVTCLATAVENFK